jgi:type I restriction enzyme R subunit
MFLTGFDSPPLNTLYVDKNLKYHGLIQAYSRTNRILNEQKSQGNIVVFRNLKKATDEAITLFSNKEAIEVIIMEPYEDYVEKFNKSYINLLNITPTVNSVNELVSEEDELEFIKAFRDLMRLKNTMTTFANFEWEDLAMEEQLFNDFRSKYLDLWQKTKTDTAKEKVSILDDVDFELELIHRDEINVTYILKLLAGLKDAKPSEQEEKKKEIVDMLAGEAHLRSKKELIEKFIQENLPVIEDADAIPQEFENFWTKEQQAAFEKFVKEENLSSEKTQKLIEDYLYAEREPLRDELLNLIDGEKPSVLKRKSIGDRILTKLVNFVDTFINGVDG